MLASSALREVIEGPLRPGHVLGASRLAVWAAIGEQVIVVARPEAVRLPNCVVMNDLPDTNGFSAGCGAIVVEGQRIVVSRWFDPKPVLPATSRREVRRTVGVLAQRVEPAVDCGLGAALACGNPVEVIVASTGLVGRGPGLTPSGDDLLAGAVSAFLHLGAAVGDPSTGRLNSSVGPQLRQLAGHDTTTLSCALICHALIGEVALPVARLLSGLAGRGSIDDAIDDLLAVGHSSGHALAQGVLAGAAAVGGGRQ